MKVNISIELDISSPSDEKVLHSLMPILNGSVNSISTPGKELPQSPGPVTPDKPARKRRTKAQIAADKAAESAKAAEAEAEVPPAPKVETVPNPVEPEEDAETGKDDAEAKTDNLTGVTMGELREAVVSKLEEHTKAIKDKLEAFGVAKVTQLKPEQYNEFLIFVKKLK